jgi:hypothetical protein
MLATSGKLPGCWQARTKAGKGRVFSKHHARDSLVARCILRQPRTVEQYGEVGQGFSFSPHGRTSLSAADVQAIVFDNVDRNDLPTGPCRCPGAFLVWLAAGACHGVDV